MIGEGTTSHLYKIKDRQPKRLTKAPKKYLREANSVYD
jgi:hypothetical protein